MMTIAHYLNARYFSCVKLNQFRELLLGLRKSIILCALWLYALALILPSGAFAQSTSGAPTANAFGVSVLENSSANTIPSQTIGIVTAVQITTPPAHGVLVVSGLNFVYTPTANYYGADNFFYTASNGAGVSAPARVSITVTQVAPTANAVSATLTVNTTNNLINTNITGSANSIAISSTPAHGVASVSGLNILYTPNAGYIGNDSFSYTASNTVGTSAPANVSITVNGLPPTANSVNTSVLQNSSANTITTNTSGGASSIAILGSPSHGTASVSGLNIIYTPTAGYVGTDSFYYSASNAYGTSPAASVTINVNGVPPTANTVNASVLQNSSVNTIASNITGSATSISLASSPAHGTVGISGLNFIYTPTAGYIGNDSFTYSATNSYGTSSIASVNVTINGIPPVANSVSASVLQDSANNTIASNITGSATSLGLFSFPSHGTATISGMNIVYTPTPGYVGTDNFKYTASNTYGTSNVASISVNINGIAPVANSISTNVLQNSSGNTIISNITGTASSITLFSTPSHGTASVSGLNIIYTPTTGFIGTDNFKYTATNAYGVSSAASINVTVNGIPPTVGNVNTSVSQNSSGNSINTNISGSANSIALTTSPAHGTASVSGLNVIYTPISGYVGTDTLQYTASNTYGTSNTGIINITVNGIPPIANALNTSVLQNSTNNTIPANLSGTAANLTLTSTPSHGTASISGLNIIYTPVAGFIGVDNFKYSASNAYGNSASADITINVSGTAPVANPVSSSILANSTDNSISTNITGSASSIGITTPPLHGSASVSGLNILYSPTSGYSGLDTLTYTATNAFGTSTPATISLTIVGNPPIASAVSATVFANTTNNQINSITSGSATSIAIQNQPTSGTISISGLSISYTPNAGFIGNDTFTYIAINSFGSSAPANVTIQVKDAIPVANPISASVFMNSGTNVINSNISGNASSLIVASNPAHGIANNNGLQIVYAPNANFIGEDSFTYQAINSSGISSPATVIIKVLSLAPTSNSLNANVISNSTNNLIPTNTSGAVDSISLTSQPQHGSAQVIGATISYTPTYGYIGSDSLNYIATNSYGSSAPATVIITVSPLTPIANPINISVTRDSSNNLIKANTSGSVNSIQIESNPSNGTVNFNGLNMLYTPNAGFVGEDTFSYSAAFDNVRSSPALVTISVKNLVAPTANSSNVIVDMNSSNNLITPNITGTASSVNIRSGPTNGTAIVDGSKIIYTPNNNFFGVDTLNYSATNAIGSSNIATITITVKGLLPIARPVNANVATNSSNNAINSSIIGDATSIELTSSPAHGSVTVSGLSMSYTPQADFTGNDSYSYLAKNSFGSSAPAVVSIQVNTGTTLPLPIANPVSADVVVNSNANSIAANITGDYSQVSLVKSPTHGTVSLNGNNFSYTPTRDYVGSDSFSYTASNASGSSNEASVTINVKQALPIARAVSAVIDMNQSAASIRPDTSGVVDRIAIGSPASHGTVTISGLEFRYTPALNYVGTDSFTYTAVNAAGSSSPATVNITVKAKAPVISNATMQVLAGSSASLELANLVSQTGGAAVSFSILSQPAHGNATLNGTRLTVNAQLNYAGADQVSIVANANGQTSNTAVIAITVTARPDPSKNPAVQGLQTSKAAIINQFERLQLENFNARLTEIASQNAILRNKEDKKNDDACNKVSLWAGGLNSFSTIATDYEIKQQNGGASFGGDRCLGSPDSVLGFGVGYANSRGELRGLNTTINANARNIANYGQFKPLPFFNFSWVLGINDISSDYTRTTEQINDTLGWAAPPMSIFAAAPSATTQHNGKWTGRQKLGSTSVGFDVTFTDFKISPYLRLDRSAVTIGAYSETGDTRSALRYQEQNFNSQRTTLGMNAETVTKTRFGELTPRLRFEYQKDVGKRDDVKINYVDNPDSTPYIINGAKLNRNLIHMGIGGDLLLDSGWVIIFNYGYYRASEGNHSNAIRLRLSYRL